TDYLRIHVYCFETFLGGGSFGVVSKFKKLEDDSRVAVKLLTNKTSFTNEVRGLSCLRELDPNKSNIIRCIDHFPYKGSYLIFYELLDQDLCDFMAKRINKPLKMGEVRCIAKQLLVSLRELKHIHVTHLDIKPNNILLVNHSLWPFKVKLADLGLARKTRLVSLYDVYQNRHYRAPEIFLGLPRDEGMDMWSLGCVLIYLILGNSLFKNNSEYSVVSKMITLFGMPHKTSLDTGWRLKTPQEYKIKQKKRSTPTVPKTKPLAELLGQEKLKPDTTKFKDFLSMIDLFKRMLTMEAADRITPDDALNHSFITMENLPDASESLYVKFGKEVLARSERASPARVTEMEEDSDQSELSGQVKQSTFTLEKGVQLIHRSNIYQVEEVIGSSANGIVVKLVLCVVRQWTHAGGRQQSRKSLFRKENPYAVPQGGIFNKFHAGC
uniref:Protein kinase domain-containing protein n=1 Tax=Nothobranchius furzeri TaxID=105023 RepID=A0A8C6NXG7_NOTFU